MVEFVWGWGEYQFISTFNGNRFGCEASSQPWFLQPSRTNVVIRGIRTRCFKIVLPLPTQFALDAHFLLQQGQWKLHSCLRSCSKDIYANWALMTMQSWFSMWYLVLQTARWFFRLLWLSNTLHNATNALDTRGQDRSGKGFMWLKHTTLSNANLCKADSFLLKTVSDVLLFCLLQPES